MAHPKKTPAERAEQRRKWAVEHSEKCRQYGRDFYARNSQKRRDASLAYYYAHKEERSAYAKAYYQRKKKEPLYLEKIYSGQKAARRRNAPVLPPRRDSWEIKVNQCRKTISEYSYRSMESIQALYPHRVERYFQNYPFDQYGHRFICNVLYRFRIYRDRAEYDDCYEAGMVAYLYSVHRCAALDCDYTIPYIRKMIRIYVLCALVIADDGRNLCRANGLRQIHLDADTAGRLY